MKLSVIFLVVLFVSVKGENGSRIAGGSPVNINIHPYSAALLTNREDGTAFTQACGGTILTNSAILSAASCFFTGANPDPAGWWRARVGSALSNSGGTIHIISRIGSHPAFSPATRANDIAVLRTTVNINLRWGFTETASIAGAVLQLQIHQPILAIGWGLTGVDSPAAQLKEVQFWVVDHQVCAGRYAAVGFTVTDNMVCTGWLDVPAVRAQCQGDGGSPIIADGVVVGVHSYVEGCGDNWFPGVNTRVAPYTRWIVAEATA